jgi:hypothetical protein
VQRPDDRQNELLDAQRLLDVFRRAAIVCGLRDQRTADRGHEQNGRVRISIPDVCDEIEPIDPRRLAIDHDDVERALVRGGDGMLAACLDRDVEAPAFEGVTKEPADEGLAIDQQNCVTRGLCPGRRARAFRCWQHGHRLRARFPVEDKHRSS